MKRKLYRVLVALTMLLILFCFSACGGTTDATNEESFPETEEESEESEEVGSEEVESETETEDTDNVVTDGEYTIYTAFIKTFEINDNVLKVETEDVFEDYKIPTEMAINFEYPLATDVAWSDNVTKVTDEDDWFAWFSFSLEGITKAAERYNDGQYGDYYTSGEDFCKKNAVWTFVIKDETVQSISMDLVKDEAEETTAAETKTEESGSVAPSAKKDTTASTPTTAPAHEHRYTSSVAKEASCASEGIMSYVCSCGDSYTESIAANGNHNWKEIYGTVEHPSEGEMRQIEVGTSGEVYVCNACGGEFSSAAAQREHIAGLVGVDNDHVMRGGVTIRSGQPIYQEQWIVTKEAWSESVVTGYQCTICGATK